MPRPSKPRPGRPDARSSPKRSPRSGPSPKDNRRPDAPPATRPKRPRPGADAPELRDAARGERLQRVLADAGVAARRKCEEMIAAGRVEVNGLPVTTLPAWVDPARDRIAVDGRPIATAPERHLYVLLNKPPRTLTAVSDEPGADRRTVNDLVDHPLASRLFPVGRLDYDTVGLLLLTNDGELANRLTHPKFGVPKTYRAKVGGVIDDDAIAELERGIYLAERKEGKTVGAVRTSRVELAIIRRERDATWLEITLREGRNRQVRRMLAAVGLPVKKLERTAMGPLQLKGVARGAWRELSSAEVGALRRAAADSRSPQDRPAGAGPAPNARATPPTRPAPSPATTPARSRLSAPADRPRTPDSRSTRAPTGPKNTRAGRPAAPPPPDPRKIGRRTVKNAVNRLGRAGRDAPPPDPR